MKSIVTFIGKRVNIVWLLVFILSACSPAAAQPETTATLLPTSTASPSPAASPTATPLPTETSVRTPPALPGTFQTDLLNPKDPAHTYIPNACQYLRDKWSSANSTPGTIAIAVMFHEIVSNDMVPDADGITEKQFNDLMGSLMNHRFEAITSAQLAEFLYHNAKIPERSVLLVQDDRRHLPVWDKFWRPYWEADGWPVINAYISAERDGLDASIFQEQEIMNAEGWVDYQAHGVVSSPLWPGTSDSFITSELQGSIDAFKVHFNKVPIAYIWPGGGFSPRAVEIAREIGYLLGFTINPRGPIMYNWIPLGDSSDPQRPSWIPEGSANDPLLVLPRYWDKDVTLHLDKVVQISQQAASHAAANRDTELEYYDIVCASQLGPLP